METTKKSPNPSVEETSVASKTTQESAKNEMAKSLKELFEDGLKDIYWAEKALTSALPKMYKNATNTELKTALSDHLTQTQHQLERLEQVFESMGKKAVAKKCEAMAGILQEGDGIVEDTQPGAVRDAGIIAACQKVEHYEIATYGTLAAFAKILNEETALELLLSTLAEEKKADELLSSIADTHLNQQAL
jgi:ferritin-like metal-binding protein YciE